MAISDLYEHDCLLDLLRQRSAHPAHINLPAIATVHESESPQRIDPLSVDPPRYLHLVRRY